LRKALSERIKDGSVVIVDDLKLNSPKTKEFAGIISALDLTGTTLVVHGNENKNISLAARNLAGVTLTTGDSLNTYDVLRPDKLLFTKGAFETVEARLNKE
jgi:large subunit ribosomal protein L4